MTDKEETMQDIEIPTTAFVPCPARTLFAQAPVQKCPECPHFKGLTDVLANKEVIDIAAVPFEQRYRLNCAHIVPRKMTRVEVD